MSNRYYTEHSQRKIVSDKPRPPTGPGSSLQPTFSGADEPPYNADIGPGGPDMNRGANFPRVRTSMKEKMSPFAGGEGNPLAPGEGSALGAAPKATGGAVGAQAQQMVKALMQQQEQAKGASTKF